jgi:Niemann-Pick C2 protein
VTRVEVAGCDQQDRCVLPGGSNITFSLNFIPNVASHTLKAVVHGVIATIPVPFHVPNPDACKNSGLECPLIAGKEYHYSTTIPVLKSYPKMALSVKWELVTDKNQDTICIIIPAQIS